MTIKKHRFREPALERPNAFELNPRYPERINLRKDYTHAIDYDIFKKQVNKLVHVSYAFGETTYSDITSEVNEIVFPE